MKFQNYLIQRELISLQEFSLNESFMDTAQWIGDFLGIIDPTGAVDIANGVVYALRGKWSDAAISFTSALPFGDLVKLLKAPKFIQMIMKIGKVSEATAQLIARRTAREAIKGGRGARGWAEKNRFQRMAYGENPKTTGLNLAQQELQPAY